MPLLLLFNPVEDSMHDQAIGAYTDMCREDCDFAHRWLTRAIANAVHVRALDAAQDELVGALDHLERAMELLPPGPHIAFDVPPRGDGGSPAAA